MTHSKRVKPPRKKKDRRHSKEMGFDHHLTKPVEPGTLEKLLAQPKRFGHQARKSG